MHFSLAKFIAAVPLLASATPLAHSTHVKIPVSKRSNLQRDHGSVNIKALKASVAATTAYVISLLDGLIHDLTSSIARSVVVSIHTNGTLGNATPPNWTITSAQLA